MDGYTIERCFVAVVAELASRDEVLKSYSAFGRLAFPDSTNPENTWRSIRNGQKGKPRRITLEEACGMASAVSMSLQKLLNRAEWKIEEEGWSLEQDIAVASVKERGRPKKSAVKLASQAPKKESLKNQKNDIQ